MVIFLHRLPWLKFIDYKPEKSDYLAVKSDGMGMIDIAYHRTVLAHRNGSWVVLRILSGLKSPSFAPPTFENSVY